MALTVTPHNLGTTSNVGDIYKAYPSFVQITGADANATVIAYAQIHKKMADLPYYEPVKTFEFSLYADPDGNLIVDYTDIVRTLPISTNYRFFQTLTISGQTNWGATYGAVKGLEDTRCLQTQPAWYIGEDDTHGLTTAQKVYMPPSRMFFIPAVSMLTETETPTLQSPADRYWIYIGCIIPPVLTVEEFGDCIGFIDAYGSKAVGDGFMDILPDGNMHSCKLYLTFNASMVRGYNNDLAIIIMKGATQEYSYHINARISLLRILPHLRYVFVKWLNRFGYENCFIFELHNLEPTTDADRTVELDARPATPYDIRKSYFYKAVLFLDALRAYDVWFYSDIITAQYVQIAPVDETDTNGPADKFQHVKVTTDSLTIPTSDAGGPFKIEIEIEFNNTFGTLS